MLNFIMQQQTTVAKKYYIVTHMWNTSWRNSNVHKYWNTNILQKRSKLDFNTVDCPILKEK